MTQHDNSLQPPERFPEWFIELYPDEFSQQERALAERETAERETAEGVREGLTALREDLAVLREALPIPSPRAKRIAQAAAREALRDQNQQRSLWSSPLRLFLWWGGGLSAAALGLTLSLDIFMNGELSETHELDELFAPDAPPSPIPAEGVTLEEEESPGTVTPGTVTQGTVTPTTAPLEASRAEEERFASRAAAAAAAQAAAAAAAQAAAASTEQGAAAAAEQAAAATAARAAALAAEQLVEQRPSARERNARESAPKSRRSRRSRRRSANPSNSQGSATSGRSVGSRRRSSKRSRSRAADLSNAQAPATYQRAPATPRRDRVEGAAPSAIRFAPPPPAEASAEPEPVLAAPAASAAPAGAAPSAARVSTSSLGGARGAAFDDLDDALIPAAPAADDSGSAPARLDAFQRQITPGLRACLDQYGARDAYAREVEVVLSLSGAGTPLRVSVDGAAPWPRELADCLRRAASRHPGPALGTPQQLRLQLSIPADLRRGASRSQR